MASASLYVGTISDDGVTKWFLPSSIHLGVRIGNLEPLLETGVGEKILTNSLNVWRDAHYVEVERRISIHRRRTSMECK